MKRTISFIAALTMLLMISTSVSAAHYKIDYSSVVDNPVLKKIIKNSFKNRNNGLIKVPDEHPRLLLTKEYIEFLKENKDRDDIKPSYDMVMTYADRALPEKFDTLSDGINIHLASRAFCYAVGAADKNYARTTVDLAIKYLETAVTSQTYVISVYKDYGMAALACAEVYDWCYGAMTGAQKTKLGELIRNMLYSSNQPCSPDKVEEWSHIADKAVGQPLIYNCGIAIALYDEYPEIYETIMPVVQGPMAEIVKIYGQAGALSDGSIAYSRDYYAFTIATMFERMGAVNFYGDQTPIGYKMLYSKTPYGAYIKQGDDFSQPNYVIGENNGRTELQRNFAFPGVQFEDPYLYFQYAKVDNNSKSLEKLLYYIPKKQIEPKTPDDLPLAYYVGEPRSEIMARTSWQDGINSPAVAAYMNMNNRRTGDHDHASIGSFQIYYKGPLTMPAGIYSGEGWGGSHWANFASRTIAQNCITVYDPSEKFVFGEKSAESNDGGQKMVRSKSGGYVINKLEEHMSDSNLRAVTESHYIGPNEKTPAFSYIKGDLTKAYSDSKMASYKRGMVFMDLFNEEYPAAMVVFDRVVSKNASFQKKFLLQSCFEPAIENNRIIITVTEDGANGKLVNNTLLPEKTNIEAVGGKGMEFSVNGVNYPPEKPSTGTEYYMGGWRSEISPAEENKEDIFLNAMYVTDAEGNAADLAMIKEETDKMVGVTVRDRQVMFSKSGEFIDGEFDVTVRDNGYGEVMCLLTDVKEGKWKVAGNNTELILESAGDSHCLMFAGNPGMYVVTPYTGSNAAAQLSFEEAEKEKLGDYQVTYNEKFIRLPDETKLMHNETYITGSIFEQLGVRISKNGGVLSLDKGSVTVKIYDGDNNHIVANDIKFTLPIPIEDIGGIKYIPLTDEIASMFGFKKSFTAKTLLCKITDSVAGEDDDVVLERELLPKAVNKTCGWSLLDGKSSTAALMAESETIVYDYGDTCFIDSVYTASDVKNSDRYKYCIDVYVSADGSNYIFIKTINAGSKITQPVAAAARYLKFAVRGLKPFNMSELRVSGEISNVKYKLLPLQRNYVKGENMQVGVCVGENLTDAALYIDDNKVFDLSGFEAGIHEITIDKSYTDAIGSHEVTVRDDTEIYDSRTVRFVIPNKKKMLFDESFDNLSMSKMRFVANSSNAKKTYVPLNGGQALKISLPDMVNAGGAPFILVDNLKSIYGYYDFETDISLSSEKLNINIDLRDYNGEYSQDGGYFKFIEKGKFCGSDLKCEPNKLYAVRIRLDVINSLMKIYVDNECISVRDYKTDGLNQIRFTFFSSENDTAFIIDNFKCTFVPIHKFNPGKTNIKFEKGENNTLTVMADLDDLAAYRARYIMAIKTDYNTLLDLKMGQCGENRRYDTPEEIKNGVMTLTYENLPADFFYSDKYRAELYIISYEEIIDFFAFGAYTPYK